MPLSYCRAESRPCLQSSLLFTQAHSFYFCYSVLSSFSSLVLEQVRGVECNGIVALNSLHSFQLPAISSHFRAPRSNAPRRQCPLCTAMRADSLARYLVPLNRFPPCPCFLLTACCPGKQQLMHALHNIPFAKLHRKWKGACPSYTSHHRTSHTKSLQCHTSLTLRLCSYLSYLLFSSPVSSALRFHIFSTLSFPSSSIVLCLSSVALVLGHCSVLEIHHNVTWCAIICLCNLCSDYSPGRCSSFRLPVHSLGILPRAVWVQRGCTCHVMRCGSDACVRW